MPFGLYELGLPLGPGGRCTPASVTGATTTQRSLRNVVSQGSPTSPKGVAAREKCAGRGREAIFTLQKTPGRPFKFTIKRYFAQPYVPAGLYRRTVDK